MKPTRRRFIRISASVIGAGILHANGVKAATLPSKPYEWQGVAMGASAQISIYAHSETQAKNLFRKCENEIARVENLFSLFKPDSQISQLNARGDLLKPNFELVELLSRCKSYAQITKGAFDVTIQPLWKLYENHFANSSAELSKAALNGILDLIGSENIKLSADKISFTKPKMAISLNGVAQGYLTDKVTKVLQQAGFENMLVHMGETYGSGQHEDGSHWRAGILSPQNQTELVKQVELKNLAIATSGGYGSPFSTDGHHHLLNPKTGLSANLYASVSVVADDALTADMLSTAFYIMPMDQIETIWHKFPQLQKAIFIDLNGNITEKQT